MGSIKEIKQHEIDQVCGSGVFEGITVYAACGLLLPIVVTVASVYFCLKSKGIDPQKYRLPISGDSTREASLLEKKNS